MTLAQLLDYARLSGDVRRGTLDALKITEGELAERLAEHGHGPDGRPLTNGHRAVSPDLPESPEPAGQVVQGAPEPDPPEEPPDDAIEQVFADAETVDLWALTDQLRLIQDHAHHRLVSPAALLGETLLRVIAAVPPGICLPPITGGRASLNLFLGLVGESGIGKGGAVAAADDTVRVTGGLEPARLLIGTGEGMVKTYRWIDRNGNVDESRSLRSAVFTADEISTLATLTSVLKTAYMGAALGFTNAKAEARSHLPAHTYRLGMSVGIQPALSDVLFRDEAGGMPQRWLFVPLADPGAPEADVPHPGRLIEVNVGHWGEHDQDNIMVPDPIRAAVRARRLAVLRAGHADPMSSHRTLTWLKVAAGVALLHGRPALADVDLLVAARLVLGSDAAIATMRAAVAREGRQRVDAAHERQAVGAVKTQAALDAHRRGEVGNGILDALRSAGGCLNRRDLLKRWNAAGRADAVAALDALAGQGLVRIDPAGNQRYTVTLVTR